MTALLAEGRAHPDTVESFLEFLGDAATSVSDLADDLYFTEIPRIPSMPWLILAAPAEPPSPGGRQFALLAAAITGDPRRR
ncbi:hypothetical protein [Micromonospora maritima]|uniref:hypothetical protein n=1 Tax=Micromonospora maritima TaxID=986711 RepID=UPI00157C9688|nr:hypothetical protein [Micromonospora maritima]